jgi:hypothetical protein
MLPYVRALRLFPLFLFVFMARLPAQDMPTRVEAVQLLERANGVIRASHLMPNVCYTPRRNSNGTWRGLYVGERI